MEHLVITDEVEILKSQNVISNPRAFNRAKPKAFTWEGYNMIAVILKSEIAIQHSIQIIRAFTKIERNYYLEDKTFDATVGNSYLIKALVNEVAYLKKRVFLLENNAGIKKSKSYKLQQNSFISDIETQQLKKLAKEKTDTRKDLMQLWSCFKKFFKIKQYKYLLSEQFSQALQWINEYKV